jgi:hypothetical protein
LPSSSIDRSDILGTTAGPVTSSDWEDYGFKGGSEPGVLNMTVWLLAKDGTEYAVSATQNHDSAVDRAAFVSALQLVLTHLKWRPHHTASGSPSSGSRYAVSSHSLDTRARAGKSRSEWSTVSP